MKSSNQVLGWLLAAVLALPGWQGANADELYQKVTSVDEISTEDIYILSNEYASAALRGISGKLGGKVSLYMAKYKNGIQYIDTDDIPDEFSLVPVEGKTNVYQLKYTGSEEYLGITYISSSKYGFERTSDGSDTGVQWKLTASNKGVYLQNVWKSSFRIMHDTDNYACWSADGNRTYARLFRKLTGNGKIAFRKESGSYASFVVPSGADYDFSKSDGLQAFIATGATKEGVTLQEVEKVPAGTPVYILGDEGNYVIGTTSGVASLEDNLLKEGSSSTKSDGKTYYALASLSKGIGFYLVAEDVKIPVGKVYLEIKDAGAKDFIGLFEDGGVTRISSTAAERQTDDGFYSLQGTRLPATPNRKGIYLYKGKKIIIK